MNNSRFASRSFTQFQSAGMIKITCHNYMYVKKLCMSLSIWIRVIDPTREDSSELGPCFYFITIAIFLKNNGDNNSFPGLWI